MIRLAFTTRLPLAVMIAIGIKQWENRTGSEAGGQRLAILYSFAATCKANGICFRTWLEEVLSRLTTTPAGLIDSLIPEAKQSSQ